MEKFVYFASDRENFPEGARLALGFGFTPGGGWRPRPKPEAEALAVDDRFAPNPTGLREAVRFLREWRGRILWDFERPPGAAFAALLESVGAGDCVLPPAWAALPHAAVLAGPHIPGLSFSRWLAGERERFGALVLDAAPIRHFCAPGCPPRPWTGALPETGLACPGAGCLWARTEGGFLYWDTQRSLLRRCRAARIPAVVLLREWEAIGD